jgi:hypothetical protein
VEYQKLGEVLEGVKRQQLAVRVAHSSLLQTHHENFHPVWGRLLKTGYQNSRFAHQVSSARDDIVQWWPACDSGEPVGE